MLCEKKENLSRIRELGFQVITLTRVVRRSLTESRRKDMKELRKYSIEISGGSLQVDRTAPRRKTPACSCGSKEAGGEKVGWRVVGCRRRCQPDHSSF